MEFNHYEREIHRDNKRLATNFKDQYLYDKNETGDSGNTYWRCVEKRSGNMCGVRNTHDQREYFFEPDWSTHSSSKPRINSCEKDKDQADLTSNNINSANIAGDN